LKPQRLNTPIQLSKEFIYALDQMENGTEPLFITGRAGTGKSTLLNIFTSTTKKRVVVLAPTGIAALNVKGQTIHSFFRFPPKMLNREDINKRRNHYLYKKVDTIVIDEISMVRVDMLDNIDQFLQINRDNPQLFGGVQMIFFGDLFQLPPIVANPVERQLITQRYDSPYFFSSFAIQSLEHFEMLELHKVYRQEERRFIRLLDSIRMREFDYDDMEELNERHVPIEGDMDFYITLSARNNTVNSINTKRLDEIEYPSFYYPAKIAGQFNPSIQPTKAILECKLGAQVMFIKNDPEKKFVNGTIGKIVDISQDHIKVVVKDKFEENQYIDVERLDWEVSKYVLDEKTGNIKTQVIGTFTQYPLKLAWAITIHKSQGQTFDNVIIDIGKGAFEYGQTYVALSRCRTLGGIVLKRPIRPQDVIVDQKVIDFYQFSR